VAAERAGGAVVLPWMSIAVAPPTGTCCVPGTTGTIHPCGTSGSGSSPMVTSAPAVTVP